MKLRGKTQTFMDGNSVRAFYCIQILQGRRWTFLGDDSGIFKFEKSEERDAKMAEIIGEPVADA